MSFSKRFIGFLPVLFLFFTYGCSEETTVEPPEPPPQIDVLATYSKNIDPTKGLQNNDVFDVLVDSNGKIWFATASGVSRFDGKVSEAVFNQNNGLPNPKCRTLAEYNGKLWVGTWGGGIGVYDLNGDIWSKLNTDSGLVNNLVADIDVYQGTLYIATNGGVNTYVDDRQRPMNQRWTLFRDALLGNLVSVVEVDSTSRGREAWYGPRGDDIPVGDEDMRAITVQRESHPQPIHYTITNSGLPEPKINDIFFDADEGVFWIALETKGLARVDVSASTWTVFTVDDGLPSEIVHSVTKVNGAIWVGTQNGVARQLSTGRFRGYARAGGLPADRVRVVYTDSMDRLFLGFIEGGAALVNAASAE